MSRTVQVLLSVLFALFLSGCPFYDIMETQIDLTSETSGSFNLVIRGVSSDEEDQAARDKDLAYLLYEMVLSSTLGKQYISHAQGKVTVEKQALIISLSGRFNSREAFNDFFDLKIQDDRFVYALAANERIKKTNSRIDKDASGHVLLSWPLNVKRITYSLQNINPKAEKPLDARFSLVPEYEKYQKTPDYYKQIYVNMKLNNGYEALRDKRPEQARKYFEEALRVDPGNKAVQDALTKPGKSK